jgi:alanyl-tRNA synthetase
MITTFYYNLILIFALQNNINMMTVGEIRTQFLKFFESKGHSIVDSAPMVIKNDPTLMFTNAGMNQFKDYFLGYAKPSVARVTNSQKCLRVSGKQNDLEEVGVDTYHHTMFEMLGNWSFGDYFKKEAISWSWELLTEVYKLDKNRLYVTVFEGDKEDGVPFDQESFDIWKQFIAEDRILFANKKDNFWEMGDTGPCGPCTEIHVDIRTEEERKLVDGKSLVNNDHPQVIEIWNNVFMQFNRKANGNLEPLPSTHVDTGMGLERLAMALQGVTSNYDTDLFQTLIKKLEILSGKKYKQEEKTDIALRVIADHVRAISFSIADGQLPSNTGAGYVIRRILRRAVRYGYSTLGMTDSFLSPLSEVLIEMMGDQFNELHKNKDLIINVIREEETSFFRTLELGLKRVDSIITKTKAEGKLVINGATSFELYDTFGFPIDLTALIAAENGLSIDEVAFEAELQQQKDRARIATATSSEDWIQISDDCEPEFVGYDENECSSRIVKYRSVTQKQKTFFQIVLDKTPFYAESGGQLGDTGILTNGKETIFITDTKKENNLIVHLTDKMANDMSGSFQAKIDASNRLLSASNHSATHLLHHALRSVLGNHVEQKGSLVGPNYLRFDFSHFAKVTDEDLSKIETIVRDKIKNQIPLLESRYTPIEEAKSMGAMALFGEKYGDSVRVIKFGESIELCGGTHVQNTGQIGLFTLKSESAIAAGIRRIEAYTNAGAEQILRDKAVLSDQIGLLLKNPKDLLKTVEELQAKNQQLLKQIDQYKKEQNKLIKKGLLAEIKENNGVKSLQKIMEIDGAAAKEILLELKLELTNFVGVIGGKEGDKCSLTIVVSDNLTSKFDATKMVKDGATFIQGGGGGNATFASAGGKNPNGLEGAMEVIARTIG